MGWTHYNSTYLKPNGEVDRKKELDSEFRNDYTVLKSAMVGTTYYAAIKKEATGEVFGYVALTSSWKKGGYNFGYKSMDETMGPNESKCPLSILSLLTETDYEYALEWRERCRRYHREKKSPNSFANLPIGTKVIWTIPHDHFTGGEKGDRIELVKTRRGKGKTYWFAPNSGWRTNPKYVNMTDCEILAAEGGQ